LSTIAGGKQNNAGGTGVGDYTFIGGGSNNRATGDYSSVLGGLQACATKYGQRAYASGCFAAQGDAQQTDFVLRTKTTNATATNVWLDGASTRLLLTTGKAYFVTVNVSGLSSTGGAGAHYIRKVAIKNVGGTVTLIGAVSTIGTDVEDVAGYDVTITADNTNKALDIKVTGAASTTLRWVVHVQGLEMAYGV
ncbi:MAG: hypothetical protein EBU33_10550, partial [Sphingobacteriia bacterium]|nr:hypothetical protein [Sphingobacteriia bacterium]